MSIVIYRYINGIVLNPKEYLLGDDGKELHFPTFREALDYLESKGITNLEDHGIHVADEVDDHEEEEDVTYLPTFIEPLDDAVAWEENEIAQERED